MRIQQSIFEEGRWRTTRNADGPFQLVLAFGATRLVADPAVYADLRRAHPDAHIAMCSTAGEIIGTRVRDDTVVATTIGLERTRVRGASTTIAEAGGTHEAGRRLAATLAGPGLRYLLVLSDGSDVNGSALTRGLAEGTPRGVMVTGGLAADGARFSKTLVGLDQRPDHGRVLAIGFYGEALRIGSGSLGGWDSFGPERLITRSAGNVLYELDGQSALALYKDYLGEHAAGLPASGLLFPLSLREGARSGVVRTLLAIDQASGGITFAGDMPEGAYARLMKANFDRLIDGAHGAAELSVLPGGRHELGLLISCVGRKLVLQQRIEEEVECVRDVLGPDTVLAGFYSNGEISPYTPGACCELHNQTMTITTLSEAET